MYIVFDADTLKEVPNDDLQSATHFEAEPLTINIGNPSAQNQNTMVRIRHVEQRNIVGPQIRSKFGCTCCKKDRKKCDERRPKCGKCSDKGRECIYLPPETRVKYVSKTNRNETQVVSTMGEISNVVSVPETITNENNIATFALDTSTLQVSPTSSRGNTITAFASSSMRTPLLLDITSDYTFDFEVFVNPPDEYTYFDDETFSELILPTSTGILSYPTLDLFKDPFKAFLSDEGIKYLRYFQTNVSELLCLTSADSPNQFVSTFLSMAQYDEAILYALAAWGGYFMETFASSENNTEVDSLKFLPYMERAKSLISERYANRPLKAEERYTLLCFYFIEMGMKICTGDVSDWYKIFKKCHKMLNSYGGILQLCEDFQYSNDVKWLVLNLQYHDIMSSVTQSKGTLFSMEDYNKLFTQNRFWDTENYGIDPFQGIMQPIYLLQGEIMNAHVTLKSWRSKIEKTIEDFSNGSVESKCLREMRTLYYKDAESTYNSLKERVTECKPSSIQVKHLSPAVRKHHLTLFEIVRNTCKLYMLLHLKQVTPASPEIQLILLQSLDYIESIEGTNLVAALPMLLLICGISCSLPCDRREMRDTSEKIYSKYKVGNLAMVWSVVEEYWSRNPMGSLSIDWADICEEKGWHLCMC